MNALSTCLPRSGIRGRLFKAVHEAPPAFDKRPNRGGDRAEQQLRDGRSLLIGGFIRYVEKCMAKDRRPPEVQT